MKKLLLLLCLMVGHGIHAQTIENHTFATAGGALTTDSSNLQFTIGEPIIGLTGSTPSLDQGFWAIFSAQHTLGTNIITLKSSEITVYPNPVSNYLNIRMNHTYPYKVTLLNMLGQKIMKMDMTNGASNAQINLSTLDSGNYIMLLSIAELKIYKSIKIIKN
ncbi:T9SS type A sorting domain-containing protein [Gelidibacter gilvus]|uniref:T9SS type A sorting domain-containing protein n=1 Tax=Gelidibacter gilvus TaxID=59602 RepID=A0A4Q0XBX2_9FLAO|nr:T9SS type A sorting domain-containing protein [Gelidibacter gilvus]RXJ44453.1 T9SS type A sorting domain-containing protein [Gelidibacter gilvus]